MLLFLLSLALLIVSGAVAWFAEICPGFRKPWGNVIGSTGAILGCVVGVVPAVAVLAGFDLAPFQAHWSIPAAGFILDLDRLSALFVTLIFGFSALAALYGSEYLAPYRGRKSLGASWMFFNALVASMAVVIASRNAVLFLIAWETMALASFFLVIFEHDRADGPTPVATRDAIRQAGSIYLIATHLGTAFLFVMFLVLGKLSGSLDFATFRATGGNASLLFILALIGFGTKAGLMPMHVWLPEAHPAAPSHVSALMSGVMIKTGIYGLIRALQFFGPPPVWWGTLLIGVGVVSGTLGVLFAVAQEDIKRLLAYSSVENIGIITLGLGVGVLGSATGHPSMSILGYAGALVHTVNHVFFKGLLFLGAGAVVHATGTREIDRLGGALKKMPAVGTAFLIGSVAIAGLPPLNGFISEFLIYIGVFHGGVLAHTPSTVAPCILALVGLALIGGLAAACFTKVFGAVFLGEPRSSALDHAHAPGWRMLLPLWVLAGLCSLAGLFAPWFVRGIVSVVRTLPGIPSAVSGSVSGSAAAPIAWVSVMGWIFAGLLVFALVARRRALAGKKVVTGKPTWDCGYDKPTPRMQYTASSFAQPILVTFHSVLRGHESRPVIGSYFPASGEMHSDMPDLFRERLFDPFFRWAEAQLLRARRFQHGQVQLYILYIFLTLVGLLIWQAGRL